MLITAMPGKRSLGIGSQEDPSPFERGLCFNERRIRCWFLGLCICKERCANLSVSRLSREHDAEAHSQIYGLRRGLWILCLALGAAGSEDLGRASSWPLDFVLSFGGCGLRGFGVSGLGFGLPPSSITNHRK